MGISAISIIRLDFHRTFDAFIWYFQGKSVKRHVDEGCREWQMGQITLLRVAIIGLTSKWNHESQEERSSDVCSRFNIILRFQRKPARESRIHPFSSQALHQAQTASMLADRLQTAFSFHPHHPDETTCNLTRTGTKTYSKRNNQLHKTVQGYMGSVQTYWGVITDQHHPMAKSDKRKFIKRGKSKNKSGTPTAIKAQKVSSTVIQPLLCALH